VILLLFLSRYCMATEAHEWVPVRPKGETILSTRSNRMNVLVKIRTHEINNGTPYAPKKSALAFGCTMTRFPCVFTDQIAVKVNWKSLGSVRSENGVVLRPSKNGPRIDIPANGPKPRETLHYPPSGGTK